MTERFDIAVVGAGPAGAVAALCLARRGRKVALWEKSAFEETRYGETLPPEINPVLRELELVAQFEALRPVESPGIVSVWGGSLPEETDFLSNPYGPGWHIDRNRFDAMLCSNAVAAGAKLFRAQAPVAAQGDSGWRIGDAHARILVDASGRNGYLLAGARQLEVDDRLLAIVLSLEYSRRPPSDLRTYIEAAPDGWWYTAPLSQGKMVAMFFTDRAAFARDRPSLNRQLRAAPLTFKRLEQSQAVERRVIPAPSFRARNIGGEGWLLVGDSASAYDPLSGRGIFKALRHASAAAAAVDSCLRGDSAAIAQYSARVESEFAAYAQKRRALYSVENRWSGSSFWLARRREGTSV